MSLREYARKRRFDGTPEPSGEAPTSVGHRPIFVVQLHHASSRHYDFRLEADGALKSWAVPKGPSLRTGEKRLAVEVEDHPLSYASFAGDIPEGHYGAGHVDVFDHGHWACDGDPLEGIAAGKLDFTLSGSKLKGAWKLVRTKKAGRQAQWLLMKRSDAYAADMEADDLVEAPSKPRRAAKTTKAAKAAKPAKPAKPRAPRKADARWRKAALALSGAKDTGVPAGFEPQLCTLRGAAPPGDDWLHEIKWDGYRLMVDMVDGVARLRSRGGLDWDKTFPEVVEAVGALPVSDACVDGELVVLGPDGHSDFSELQRVIDGTSKAALRYLVFDLVGLAGIDLRGSPLTERKTLLKSLLPAAPHLLAYSDHVVGHGAEVFAETGRQGIEGVICKRADSLYRGGRGNDWLKVKHETADEFVVVGYTDPKRSRTGFGSLLMATRERGGLRYVGRVGTGFDDAMLRDLTARLRKLEQKQATVELPGHIALPLRTVHWVRPELVAEVAFRGWAKEGLLRQAAFKRLRIDKAARDVEEPQVAKDEVTAGRITSPDRVVFEGAKYTKGDVAEYYRSVADWMLPELAGRPLSLLRCPDGTKGQCFFQKHHAESLGDDVRSIVLKQKSGKEPYLYIDDIAGVIDLVQMNTLEFHPWGSRVDDPELPDRLVFDLDPGEGLGWADVVRSARDVRARLAEAGLESFVRLSGGKGAHVVAPITRGPDWDDVRAFCGGFAEAMALQAPDRYVATMSKAKRSGKMFIDWLRNARGATSVASWSLRARKGAPVAVPIRWDELGKVAGPAAFDLAKAKQRAARLRKDPWEGFATLEQELPSWE
ncbi:DNA ligase D [Luteimonas sp. MC1828]|uniref:DNA ligase D n=1 Tax=Luteimonas sp. MC1828 TaxID=2799787 RepID=UPI0018F12B55|nr:DNA ligase D [Luteimonas sp. MC1828]